ncbi:MAG: SulP family inorganic anion transporter [Caldilineaceae bacterium]
MATQVAAKAPAQHSRLKRMIPILGWLPSYDRSWLRADVIAGLTLWGLLAPEAMAYAGIAGLPPQAGLYTLLVSLLIYALFGSSRHLSVGPTSATSALLASTVAAIAGASAAGDMAVYVQTAAALVIVISGVFLVAGIARLGFITQFLSKPVMDGFVMGLAFFVAVGQLYKIFGVPKPSGNTIEKLIAIVRDLPQTNLITFAVGAAAIALLFLLPRINKKIPAGLVVLFGAILISTVLNLSGNYEVEVVGALPQGLPRPALPQAPLNTWLALILPAIGIVLVAYSEALGVAREFAEKHGYEVDANQELNAHGITNLLSGIFGGQIAAGGMSGSAVKEGAGAQTQVANLVAWAAVLITVLLLTPLFTNLPEAVLGALIIHAVWHIIASRKLRKVRMVSQTEFRLGALTFAGVLLIDVLPGMIIGLVASLLLVIYRSSQPNVASLGRSPSRPDLYSDLARHKENLPVAGVLIVRSDAPLYYANALSVRSAIKGLVEEKGATLRAVVLDLETQIELDLTTAEVLEGLVAELQSRGLMICVAAMHTDVREFAQRVGLIDRIGAANILPTLDEAVRFAAAQPASAPLVQPD